ncbi:hypothetical protein QAD02_006933, partial [Eretmocerus hayati]
MRYFGAVLTYAVLHQISYIDSKDLRAVQGSFAASINEKLISFLEGLKDIMKTGQPTLGIPVLEPFQLESKEFNLEEGPIVGNYQVTDLYIENLSKYVIQNGTNLQFVSLAVTLDILWPLIEGSTSYKADGKLFDNVLFFGEGDLCFRLYDFHFVTQAKLKYEYETKKVSVINLNGTRISLSKSE